MGAEPRGAVPAAGIDVREAVAGDVAFLPDIERAAAAQFRSVGIDGDYLDETTPPAELAAARREGRLWVAAYGARRVGFAVASGTGDGDAWLDEVDVLPDFGRRGIGRALVERAVAWARDRGFARMGLTTFRDVAWNAPFYRRLGFRDADADAYTGAIRRLLADETARGLPAGARIVMLRELALDARSE